MQATLADAVKDITKAFDVLPRQETIEPGALFGLLAGLLRALVGAMALKCQML